MKIKEKLLLRKDPKLFKGDAKKTWKIMKDLIGKANLNKSSFPQKVRVQMLTYLTRIE